MLTAEWIETFAWYRRNADGPAKEMAAMLEAIIATVHSDEIDAILDAFALTILNRETA